MALRPLQTVGSRCFCRRHSWTASQLCARTASRKHGGAVVLGHRQISQKPMGGEGSGSVSPVDTDVVKRLSAEIAAQLEHPPAPASYTAVSPRPKRLSAEQLARTSSGLSPKPFPREPDSHPLSHLDLAAEAAAEPVTDRPAAAPAHARPAQQSAQAADSEPPGSQEWVPAAMLPAPPARTALSGGSKEPEVVRSSGFAVGAVSKGTSDEPVESPMALPLSPATPRPPPPPPPLLLKKPVPQPPPAPPPPAPRSGLRPPPPPVQPPAPGPRAAPKAPPAAHGQPTGPVLAMQPRVKLRGLFWSKSDRRQDTVWDVVSKGKLPMEEDHLAALEALFPATSAGPLTRTGGDGTFKSDHPATD